MRRVFPRDEAGPMNTAAMESHRPVHRVAIVGTGTIGASWATPHLVRGFDVTATDPSPTAETAGCLALGDAQREGATDRQGPPGGGGKPGEGDDVGVLRECRVRPGASHGADHDEIHDGADLQDQSVETGPATAVLHEEQHPCDETSQRAAVPPPAGDWRRQDAWRASKFDPCAVTLATESRLLGGTESRDCRSKLWMTGTRRPRTCRGPN
ncbi:3-hydroxyacyl-CoA dehydrogenase NAD-binding domain-containing protein [Streptomyces sp. NPDC001406]|uniref:3-hydroxyacyl-CoA dehydrogenase NAD-binding domain-containing protein n=1 Tax=Streptomyces sp. NPDC001406 TaxID=3364572 RepID=UPI0036C7CAD3